MFRPSSPLTRRSAQSLRPGVTCRSWTKWFPVSLFELDGVVVPIGAKVGLEDHRLGTRTPVAQRAASDQERRADLELEESRETYVRRRRVDVLVDLHELDAQRPAEFSK